MVVVSVDATDSKEHTVTGKDVERLGVVGCGLMGSGIAEAGARSGLAVRVVERDEAAIDAGRRRLEGSLQRAVKANKLTDVVLGVSRHGCG